MKQHKWHKEILHFINGGKVISELQTHKSMKAWGYVETISEFDEEGFIFRIKPQPKEPKYLYAFWNGMIRRIDFATEYDGDNEMCKYIGKIKLEVDDE